MNRLSLQRLNPSFKSTPSLENVVFMYHNHFSEEKKIEVYLKENNVILGYLRKNYQDKNR